MNLLHHPFPLGVVVVMCWMTSFWHMADHVEEQTCVPLTVEIITGTPNLDIQPEINASEQVASAIFCNGMASTYLVVLSMTVRM
jgi:hypothetical protein